MNFKLKMVFWVIDANFFFWLFTVTILRILNVNMYNTISLAKITVQKPHVTSLTRIGPSF